VFELDVQVHADITPVAFVAVMVRTLVGFVDFAGSPPLLLLMSLGQHLAALLEKFLHYPTSYFDVADHRCKLLVLQGELLRLENYHLVDEVGLPKLFVVADVLIVLRVFYIITSPYSCYRCSASPNGCTR
jgi:hypothetical protein